MVVNAYWKLRNPVGGNETQQNGGCVTGINKGAVVITGTSSGIGKTCAVALDRAGYRVFAGVRDKTALTEWRRLGSANLIPLPLDITDPAQIMAAVQLVQERLAPNAGLKGLINNAGITIPGPIELVPIEQIRSQMETNVVAQVAITQAFLPLLRSGGGRIVNIGSILGRFSMPFAGVYAASKYALEAITDSMRRELWPWGIWVAIVEPGTIATSMRDKVAREAEKLQESMPDWAKSGYGQAAAAVTAIMHRARKRALPPDQVAKAVLHALESPRPRRRYRVGGGTKLVYFISQFIPSRLIDRGLQRILTPGHRRFLGSTSALSPNRAISTPGWVRKSTTSRPAGRSAVLVTGASSGIGQACALILDRAGYRVFAGVRTDEAALGLRNQASPRLVPIRLDITDALQIDDAVELVSAALGPAEPLAGLINNAGIVVAGPLEHLPIALLRRQLDVNVVGQIAVTTAFLPLLRRGRGRIIVIGSDAGWFAVPFLGAYSASKFAMEAITDALRREISFWGVRVVLVEPGCVQTPVWDKTAAETERLLASFPEAARHHYGERYRRGHALLDFGRKHALKPESIAKLVLHALECKQPAIRYLAGIDSRALAMAQQLVPDFLLDRAINLFVR